MIAEHRFDLFALVKPQQAVIDEYAGQLIANRLMNQDRGDRGVDTARQSADHPALAHLRADFRNLGGAEFSHRPVARQSADLVDEVGDQLRAVRGMDHFGMELRAVIAAVIVRDHRKGRAFGGGHHAEARGKGGYLVAVAHPHLMLRPFLP